VQTSYSTGAVYGGGGHNIGGLVWYNSGTGTLEGSYSTGAVLGDYPGDVGGLVGKNDGTVTGSFWDTTTSGQSSSAGGTGLTDAGMRTASNFTAAGWSFDTTPGGPGWVIADSDGTFNNAAGATGATTPMLLGEYSTTITNGHQLQLVGLTPGASYTLANDLNLSATSVGGDVWGPAGFAPICNNTTHFTGTFNGNGHVIDGLAINLPDYGYVGLFGAVDSSGLIENLGLVGGSVTGYSFVGGLAGRNSGTVEACYNTGVVNGRDIIGGLVGWNFGGAVETSYNMGAVSAGSGGQQIGGLVGLNAGALEASYNTGAVSAGPGSKQIGGLAGENGGSVATS
jgi:hypothetical protein